MGGRRMGVLEVFLFTIGIVVLFALIGYIFASKDENPAENAKLMGIGAIFLILQMLPAVIFITFIVLLVKSCS